MLNIRIIATYLVVLCSAMPYKRRLSVSNLSNNVPCIPFPYVVAILQSSLVYPSRHQVVFSDSLRRLCVVVQKEPTKCNAASEFGPFHSNPCSRHNVCQTIGLKIVGVVCDKLLHVVQIIRNERCCNVYAKLRRN